MPPWLKSRLESLFGKGSMKPGMKMSLLTTTSVSYAFQWRIMFIEEGNRLRYIFGCALECELAFPAQVMTEDELKRLSAGR